MQMVYRKCRRKCRPTFCNLFVALTLVVIVSAVTKWLYHHNSYSIFGSGGVGGIDQSAVGSDVMTLVVVCCGEERVEETLVMIKSAAALTLPSTPRHRPALKVIVFTEDYQIQAFREHFAKWPNAWISRVAVEVRPVQFPSTNTNKWKSLFKKCASQRLYLPELLPDVTRLLYVDTDVLFLSSVTQVWSHWSHMSGSHICAVTPEHEDPSAGWYNRFARHPYYGKLGINSGVMLMDLSRIRAKRAVGGGAGAVSGGSSAVSGESSAVSGGSSAVSGGSSAVSGGLSAVSGVSEWSESMRRYYATYKYNLTWGDQDLINIYFHYHPEEVYIYECTYNYRPDHCMYMSNCKPAHTEGVKVLHGSRRVWHTDKQPVFYAIYHAWKQYAPGSDLYNNLLVPMRRMLTEAAPSQCGKVRDVFTKHLTEHILNITAAGHTEWSH